MPASPEEITRRADMLYAAREETENVRASLGLLQGVLAPPGYEVLWRLGRALFFLGQEAQHSGDARVYHAQGVQASVRAARLEPERVEGHFWLGVNAALLARLENPFRALRHALRARRELERAARIDAAYHAAGPLRVLGRLQHKLPRFLGGGRERARASLQRAIEIAPANTVTRLYFAEMLLETGDADQARLQLETILKAPPDPAWMFEIKRDQRLAREMLEKMELKR